MKVYHLSCGSMCPFGGHLMDGVTPGLGPATLVCHCLLIESAQGLVLVDTGFGTEDVRNPAGRIPGFFRALNRPNLKEEHTALRQIQALGYRAEDVRHIVITHLDFDHAGGISDFPQATVHVYGDEYEHAMNAKGFIQTRRFRPQQWPKHELWQRYRAEGEHWFGFQAVRDLKGLPTDILFVPLVGHTMGHCGVAVREQGRGWMLLAGDAYFHHGEMAPDPYCPAGAKMYERMMDTDRSSRLWNQERLRRLISEHREITVFSSHDRTEYDRLRRTAPLTFRLDQENEFHQRAV